MPETICNTRLLHFDLACEEQTYCAPLCSRHTKDILSVQIWILFVQKKTVNADCRTLWSVCNNSMSQSLIKIIMRRVVFVTNTFIPRDIIVPYFNDPCSSDYIETSPGIPDNSHGAKQIISYRFIYDLNTNRFVNWRLWSTMLFPEDTTAIIFCWLYLKR